MAGAGGGATVVTTAVDHRCGRCRRCRRQRAVPADAGPGAVLDVHRSRRHNVNGRTGRHHRRVRVRRDTASCDGGGGGAGGGGVVGGAQGDVQFGSGSSDEWYGYGGYPGQNSTGGVEWTHRQLPVLPRRLRRRQRHDLLLNRCSRRPDRRQRRRWRRLRRCQLDCPQRVVGESAVSDYIIEYALASDPTNWTTFAHAVSTGTSTTVTGLTDGTAYVFQVSAVNTAGQGDASAASDPVTPIGVPGAPTITAVTAHDGALSLAFTAPSSGNRTDDLRVPTQRRRRLGDRVEHDIATADLRFDEWHVVLGPDPGQQCRR